MPGREMMRVAFVENEYQDIEDIVETLKATELFDVVMFTTYALLNDETIDHVDLFVLDVLMEGESESNFVNFVKQIGGRKPFIAYTKVDPRHFEVNTYGGRQKLRDFVYKNSGMAILLKRPEDWHSDVKYGVISIIMSFYWNVSTMLSRTPRVH